MGMDIFRVFNPSLVQRGFSAGPSRLPDLTATIASSSESNTNAADASTATARRGSDY